VANKVFPPHRRNLATLLPGELPADAVAA